MHSKNVKALREFNEGEIKQRRHVDLYCLSVRGWERINVTNFRTLILLASF